MPKRSISSVAIPGNSPPSKQVLTEAARSRSFRSPGPQSYLFPLLQVRPKPRCPHLGGQYILRGFGPRKGRPRSPQTIRHPCRNHSVRQRWSSQGLASNLLPVGSRSKVNRNTSAPHCRPENMCSPRSLWQRT